MRETDFVGGFAKGLRVIEALGEDRPRLSIADVSKITGLDRATARRCLLTLAELGYAEYDGKFFMLLPRILRLGHAYLSGTPLPTIIQSHLDRLSQSVGESASASVLDGAEIVYIARASQMRVISINLMAGSRLPAYCASMGRVLLAWLDESEARTILEQTELRARTPFTQKDPEKLMEELRRIRAQGFAVNDQELELGLRSIAVPVFNHRGAVVAALNIGAPVAHVEVSDLVWRILPEMLKIQSELRSMLRQRLFE
ncbi:IclR family transcriptional regulator [Brucella abortus]|uniref:IclR family transcriptional regulator n=1 Tax=Brucella abortus TaxID=235 RepID=UPI0037345BA9